MISLNAAQRHLVAGSSCGSMLRLGGEATLRAPGLVPVANVQLLIGTFSVLFSSLMASLRTLFVGLLPKPGALFPILAARHVARSRPGLRALRRD
jgi:hypothetical protein